MKSLRTILMFCVVLLASVAVSAQQSNNVLVNISYDPHGDSVFFKKIQQRMAEIRKTRPTVALVLAGGGAKGAAHIGVLKYLEEKGIPVDLVAGTSMGGLMGGLYAMGYSAKEIDTIVQSIDWNMMMSDNIPMGYYSRERQQYKETYVIDIPFKGKEFVRSLPSGYLYGRNVYNMMSALSVGYQHDMDFMDLPTPYCCVATEIVTQTEKRWAAGPLIDAMRSTMSIPGYFRPVRVDSMILSDGGTKNNFPTDVAKAAGADIIIGVELTMPRDYSKVNNVADILMQTAQYSGGLEAHNRNVKNATVYITPDITGFGMLSFGTKEIATLIDRGYAAAQLHEREIDSVVRIVGNEGRKLYNSKAVNIDKIPVKITSVEYVGITEKEKEFLNGKIRMDVDEYYSREDFEIAQAIIFGTKAFSQVIYRLIGDGADGYKLLFKCEKRPENSIAIGLRADTEDWFAALINVGFGRNKIYGSQVDLIARLSTSPYFKVNYSYIPIKGPKFGASLKTHYRMLMGHDIFYAPESIYVEHSLRNELMIYISDTHWSLVELSGGFRLEQMPFYRFISKDSYTQEKKWKNFYPFVYMRFSFNNEDSKYFPNKGLRFYVNYDFGFTPSNYIEIETKKMFLTHYVATGVTTAISIGKFFTIIPSLRGRYVFGDESGYSYMHNYVGGVMEGRYYDHQIPFIGTNGELLCTDLLTTVDLNLRFKVYKNCYLSAIGAALHSGYLMHDIGEELKTELLMESPVYAVGVQFAYNSKFGPLMANLHWNSKNQFGVYLGVGYDF